MSTSLNRLKSLHVSDLRGVADVAVRTTRDVTGVTEGVHRSIHATLGLPGSARPGRTAGITGLVYRSIDGITRLTGAGLDVALGLTESLATRLGHRPESSRERDVLLGIVNGVLGDRLERAGNPLALPMALRYRGAVIGPEAGHSLPDVNGKLLVMIHGLCMTEHGWKPSPGEAADDLGARLAEQLGYTPVYLRYNTGRAIAANGAELSEQLEALTAAWPVPVEDITLLGHSMGGLVARSAAREAAQQGHDWGRQLRHLIFLGTPHHGAPLERAGAWIDALLHATPWSRPFVALTTGRSQGIQDLRHGEHALASPLETETATACPLPEGVHALAIAGTRSGAAQRTPSSNDSEALACDGLVPVASALGRHPERHRDLGLHDTARVILPAVNHLHLLRHPEVTRAVIGWLSAPR
ncbi:MAG: alpha/beta hydrolase [Xanthomonadales bacterium]|jgi:pimeloyl-ACP methyl ester carboxylesterase|nr:alpha/beta hydrolase [Xanthomonadales bacterium]